MATIPFALSISHLVSSAGADVGFAAILGLAVLVLLFFSQARETATLRRRADEAEEQLRDLAAYVEQLLRRPAGQPTPARPPGRGPAPVGPAPRPPRRPPPAWPAARPLFPRPLARSLHPLRRRPRRRAVPWRRSRPLPPASAPPRSAPRRG